MEYKYPAILYIYLNSWLFCTVKNLFYQSAVCYLSLFALLFLPYEKWTERLSRTKSTWIINVLYYCWVFVLGVFIFTCLMNSSKYGTTRKNTQQYYIPKHLIRCIYYIHVWFFFCLFSEWGRAITTTNSCARSTTTRFYFGFNLLAYKPIESWSFPQIHVLTTYLSFLWLLLSPSPPNSCIMKTCASVCAPGALPLRSLLSTHNVLRACN